MNELKKFYIAPEAELLCFEPVENIAVFLTDLGSGETPNEGSQNSWNDNTPNETTSGSPNPDGDWWL